MTVAELIARLQACPQDMTVATRGYESGFDGIYNLTAIKVRHVEDKDREWWDGEYQDGDDANMEILVLIKGRFEDEIS